MLRTSWRGLLLLLIIIPVVLGAEDEFSSNLILDIKVNGNVNIDTELIRSFIVFQIGDILDDADVAKTIKDLYQLAVFKDILISREQLPAGIIIHIDIAEYPLIENVTFQGNDKIKTAKLEELLSLNLGNYWSPFLQEEVKKKIADEYKQKGYHLAQIDFEVLEKTNNAVDLNIIIQEGSKIVIRTINIHGNKDIPEKKLLGKMKTKKASLFRSGKFEQDKFEQDLDLIVEYYNRKGFVDARIISWDKTIKEDGFALDIYLYEGDSYKFGQVSVTGNKRFTDEVITSQFKFKEDETFNLQKFNDQLSGVAAMYYEDGYIYSNFDHELEKKDDHINIRLDINENTRARIRKIFITGNRKTKEKIIRRHLAISPGDYYQQSKLRRTLSNIYNMGFFEPDLYPEPSAPINRNGDIDITINLTDKVSGSANGGVALNSQEGLVGQLAVSHNNLFGNSWQAGAQWEFGGKTQNFSFNFTNPYFMDSATLMGFDIYHTTKEWETYKVRTNGGSIRFGHPLGFLNYSRLVGGYSLYSKRYSILKGEEDEASNNLQELDAKGWQNTSALSLTFSRDSRDNIFFPTSGSQFTIYNEFAGGLLQGDFNYFKQILQVSWFSKTVWELALRTKWRFGYVTGYGGKDVPPDERFYLGGTGPDGIRGYADRSVGPDEGGLREILFSTELGVPIAGDQVVGLLFFDAGDSYNSLKKFNFWTMKKGTGLGLRVRSPFGLIGFDYAYNLDENTWEPHFQFGTTF
ncbi:MAG: outer membrane protein assembly factor BamA [Candidatus Cloacimonetes bacterium]|nr:outer membrane protein assembly factor BamA [Candidatus Cloacimonadota bacterium]